MRNASFNRVVVGIRIQGVVICHFRIFAFDTFPWVAMVLSHSPGGDTILPMNCYVYLVVSF